MENYIYLKWGCIKGYNLPIESNCYKFIRRLEKREEVLREGKTWLRREHRDKDCLELCLRAITKAPEDTIFTNTFTDEEYTREEALDYIINYWVDY